MDLAPRFRVHTHFNEHVQPQSVVLVKVALAFSTLPPWEANIAANVEMVQKDAADSYSVWVCLLDNHPNFDESNLGIDISGDHYPLTVREGMRFELDIDLTLEQWLSIIDPVFSARHARIMESPEQKKKHESREVSFMLENIASDPQIAHRVLHTPDGICTRNRFYPFSSE